MTTISLADLAKQHIIEKIETGEFIPGHQIKEEDVASKLGISRPPVREALKNLEATRLVYRKPRCGVFVRELTDKDIWEVFTLKATLYEMATGLSIDNINAREINELSVLSDKMEACVMEDPPDIISYQKFHVNFHSLIMEIAGNERLKEIAGNLHQQVLRFSYQNLQNKAHLESSNWYHRKIVNAIAKKQREEACRLVKQHVLVALSMLVDTPLPDQADTLEIPGWNPNTKTRTLSY